MNTYGIAQLFPCMLHTTIQSVRSSKKVVFLVILAVAGTYGVGRVKLGESGAMRFLMNMKR